MFQHLAVWFAQLGPEEGVAGQGAGGPAADPAAPPETSPFGLGFWVPMLVAMVLIMLLMRPRKADTELKKRLADLKKNDRVITAGGIIGSVVAIRDDNQSVTLRIDEANNTRMQVLKTSIIKILADEKSAAGDN